MTAISGIYYSFINEESRAARVGTGSTDTTSQNALADTQLTNIKLPSFVQINSKSYKITEIGAYTFAPNPDMSLRPPPAPTHSI